MYSSTLSLTSALDVGGRSAPRPCRPTYGHDLVPILLLLLLLLLRVAIVVVVVAVAVAVAASS
jgi:hypothetical protein